ncbi:MAG: hypothetical protein P8H13_04035 [Polaribacter sp.]|nr:hypothetical protein [Polaribacter sp.]MDG1811094.1 hypothetical protein [Polaribacter sp.]MDG1993483.1 hypothetical protein [Polaribacter sp.]
MGGNKHIKEIDAFAKKYVKEIKSETPSLDFTSNLMNSIQQLEMVKSAIVYKPLISKKAWLFIFVAIIAVIFIPFHSSEKGLFSLPEVNFSFLNKLNFSGMFQDVNVSNTTVIIALVFGVLLSIQIVYLKGFFEKRLS